MQYHSYRITVTVVVRARSGDHVTVQMHVSTSAAKSVAPLLAVCCIPAEVLFLLLLFLLLHYNML